MLSVKTFEFNPVRENTVVLYNELQECIIIDPGCYSAAEEDTLKSFVKSNGLAPKFLLNTHCHFDHIFGLALAAKEWSLVPFLHPLDQPVFDNAELAAGKWNIPFTNYQGPLQYLTAGHDIVLGEDRLQVRFTPGHAPGHVVFYCEAEQFVIGGDVLFQGGVGRTDLPGGDHAQLIRSIREQLLTLDDAVVVYPGHGDATTIGDERRHNPFLG